MTYAELVVNTAPDLTLPVIALVVLIGVPLLWFYNKTKLTHKE